MKDNFGKSLSFTLKYEGGYVNNPRDPGGPTNLGITIATLSHELGRQATISDVRNLSLQVASSIYRKKYWGAIGADALPGGVDSLAFDIAVNSGVGRALQWLEQTSSLPPKDRILRLHATRLSFWKKCKDKAGRLLWVTFGRGWTTRETAALALALSLKGT